jgi:hypothetical protein
MLRSVSFRAHKDESAEIRTESYLGRDWLVVPVVALVEGVLQGLNAPEPELALSEEFGRVPEGWNGRPIVMNHPVLNGSPVSANSPAVLESYAFGQIFNARVEDAKLKVDAFLDLSRVEALGGEIAETVKTLQEGTGIVEVSTGLYSSLEETKGTFNGKDYAGVWRGVVPDHLAFLSAGVKGACSVEDGCGTPRVNSSVPPSETQPSSPTARWNSYSLVTEDTDSNAGPKTHADGDCGCGCGGKCGSKEPKAMKLTVQKAPDPVVAAVNEAEISVFNIAQFVANAMPGGMYSQDARQLLSHAISSEGDSYAWVMGFTADKVIYETFDQDSYNYMTFQRSYSISDSKAVTLGDDAEPILLLTDITSASAVTGGLKANSEGEDDMSGKTPAGETGTTTTETTTEPTTTTEAPVVTANAAPTPVKMKTQAEYLAEMPEGMREVIESGIRMHNDKKAAVIKGLQESGRCKFTVEQLNAKKLDELEMLAELAQVPQTYAGVAAPVQTQLHDNSADQPDPMPELFPAKVA